MKIKFRGHMIHKYKDFLSVNKMKGLNIKKDYLEALLKMYI